MKLSISDYWSTPNDVYNELNKEWNFEWDVCADEHNHKHEHYYNEQQDALKQNWSKDFKTGWMNPPYSDVTPWLQKAQEEAQKGVTTVCFLKADHTTKWWKKYIFDYDIMKPRPNVLIRDWPKRVKFITPPEMVDKEGNPVKSVTPPWPNVVVIYKGI